MDEHVEFKFSSQRYSLRELFERFNSQLPLLVHVEQGYCGDIGINTISNGELYRIHTFSVQKRVICSLEGNDYHYLKNRYLSIPLNYPITFDVDKRHKNKTLEEILKKYPLPVRVAVSNHNQENSDFTGEGVKQIQRIGLKLRLVETYEDKYFLGNPINNNILRAEVVAIPVFLPEVELSIVSDVYGNKHSLETLMTRMASFVENNVTFDETVGNKEIAVYISDGSKMESTYEYVSPNGVYFSLTDATRGTTSCGHPIYSVLQDVDKKENTYDIVNDCAKTILESPATKNNAKDEVGQNISANKHKENGIPPVSGKYPPKLPPRNKQFFHNRPAEKSPPLNRTNPTAQEILHFNVKELSEWMEKLNLGKYVKTFKSSMIDGIIAKELDIDTLCKDFHMKRSEATRFSMFINKGHVPN